MCTLRCTLNGAWPVVALAELATARLKADPPVVVRQRVRLCDLELN